MTKSTSFVKVQLRFDFLRMETARHIYKAANALPSLTHHMGIRSILSSLGMCSSESRPKNDVQRYDNKYVNILRGFHSSSLSQAELAPGDYTGAKLKLAPEDYQMYADLKNALWTPVR